MGQVEKPRQFHDMDLDISRQCLIGKDKCAFNQSLENDRFSVPNTILVYAEAAIRGVVKKRCS